MDRELRRGRLRPAPMDQSVLECKLTDAANVR